MLSVHPTFKGSANTSRYYAGSNKEIIEEDGKIKEGIDLLVKREPKGKIFF